MQHFAEVCKDRCLRLTNGAPVIWPGHRAPGHLDVSRIIRDAKLPDKGKAFAKKNGVLAIINGSKFYVAPDEDDLVTILEADGFAPARFHVPFSLGDTPYGVARSTWRGLLVAAERRSQVATGMTPPRGSNRR